MIKIGIVTIVYNSEHVIDDFLNSLNKQSFNDFELFIIDNNSRDKTISKIKNYNLNFNYTLKINKNNIGVAAGNNQGIKLALEKKCQNILIMNNDIVFYSDLLINILNEHTKDNNVLITPKINYYYNKNIIWYGGGFFLKKRGYKQYHRGIGDKSNNSCLIKDFVDYAPTCCLFIPGKVFSDLGMMDEKYFVYYDDVDFCYRVFTSDKYKLLFCPNIIMYHKVGSLTRSRINNKLSRFFIKQIVRNHVYFLRKQKNKLKYFFIILYFFEINYKFLFYQEYAKKLSIFFLIQKSYFSGLRL
tara:strand:+ start:888 stop:1787 length:900 start_codon:yes stop_codon:yes gene_type:complete